MAATVVLSALSLLVGGALVGYRWSSDRHQPSRPAAKVTIAGPDDGGDSTAAGPLAEPAAQMPDLTQLTRDEALEALTDVGIDGGDVVFEERAYLGAAGRVVDQDPVRGTSEPGAVTLVLSTPAVVPDLGGRTADEAEEALFELGVVMQRTDVYRPNVPVGTVVGITPAPGRPVTATVSVQLAAAPASVFLSQVETLEGGCSSEPASVGTSSGADSLLCSASSIYDGDAVDPTLAFDLSGRVDRLTGAFGVPNAGEPGTSARVRVVVDGVQRLDVVAAWGVAVPLDLTLTGALRVDVFVVQPVPGDDTWEGADVAFLDATFLGARTEIDELTP